MNNPLIGQTFQIATNPIVRIPRSGIPFHSDHPSKDFARPIIAHEFRRRLTDGAFSAEPTGMKWAKERCAGWRPHFGFSLAAVSASAS
jgi:hypothetical protein